MDKDTLALDLEKLAEVRIYFSLVQLIIGKLVGID